MVSHFDPQASSHPPTQSRSLPAAAHACLSQKSSFWEVLLKHKKVVELSQRVWNFAAEAVKLRHVLLCKS